MAWPGFLYSPCFPSDSAQITNNFSHILLSNNLTIISLNWFIGVLQIMDLHVPLWGRRYPFISSDDKSRKPEFRQVRNDLSPRREVYPLCEIIAVWNINLSRIAGGIFKTETILDLEFWCHKQSMGLIGNKTYISGWSWVRSGNMAWNERQFNGRIPSIQGQSIQVWNEPQEALSLYYPRVSQVITILILLIAKSLLEI